MVSQYGNMMDDKDSYKWSATKLKQLTFQFSAIFLKNGYDSFILFYLYYSMLKVCAEPFI